MLLIVSVYNWIMPSNFFNQLLNFDQKMCRKDNTQRSWRKSVIQNYSNGLQLVMKLGCIEMTFTLRPNPSFPNSQEQASQIRSNVKVLLTVFFDFNCTVQHEFLPPDRMVNKELYRFCEIQRYHWDLLRNNAWQLYYNNGQKEYYYDTSGSVFVGYVPLWFFPILEDKNTHERTSFCEHWLRQNGWRS